MTLVLSLLGTVRERCCTSVIEFECRCRCRCRRLQMSSARFKSDDTDRLVYLAPSKGISRCSTG
ncbi:hypothetical protein TYRP_019209 [Tyrophagus putrescentiae]|nr:hypothetical protein TYRP_019209 [Tyrophagus putrescentiae]